MENIMENTVTIMVSMEKEAARYILDNRMMVGMMGDEK